MLNLLCVRELDILATEEKIEPVHEQHEHEHDVDTIIEVGKEKGYLTYGDVNEMLPEEMATSPDDLDDLITTIGTQGIDLLDGPKFRGDKEFEPEEGEDVELDLTPGTMEKTNDPVRMYLREMGTVPLLTREGEVEIAKRIERGQMRVLKAISRSPIVIREVIALGEDLKRGVRNIKEVVIFDDEELTEEVVLARVKATVARIDALAKHQKKIATLEEKQAASTKARASAVRKARWMIAREKVLVSRIVRELKYTGLERKRLLDKVNKTVDTMRTLERQIRSLEQKHESSRSDELKKEYRRQQKNCKADLEKIEVDFAVFLLTPVFLFELVAFAGFVLLFERANLALKGAHGVDGLVDLVEQALAFEAGVLEFPHDARHVDFFARDGPAGTALLTLAGLAVGRGLLLFKSSDLLLVLDECVDTGDGGAHARLHHVFSEFFFVEDHDFFYVTHAALEVFAEGHDFANHDGRTRDGLEHAHLTALDALGDFHFAFAGKQRHGAHFAQIHADGVVGFLKGARREVELNVLAFFELEILIAAELGRVEKIDALSANGCDEVVEIVG